MRAKAVDDEEIGESPTANIIVTEPVAESEVVLEPTAQRQDSPVQPDAQAEAPDVSEIEQAEVVDEAAVQDDIIASTHVEVRLTSCCS